MSKKIVRVLNGLFSIVSIVFLGFMVNAYFEAKSELADTERAIDSYTDYSKTRADAALIPLKELSEKYAIPAYMLQAVLANNGDFKRRDEIMLKSMDSMVDTELYVFLKNNKKLFIDSEKTAEKLLLSKLKDEKVREKALSKLNTSFSEIEIERIKGCYEKLSKTFDGEGYGLIFHKLVVNALREKHTCKIGI